MMKRLSYGILLIAILGLVFAGCSRQIDPISPGHPAGDHQSTLNESIASNDDRSPVFSTSSVILNGFLVEFDGRTYAGGQTTFSYTVSGAGAEHALSHFLLELPDCAPPLDSYSPPGATIGVDPHTGLYSIKWNESLGLDESRSYSITFPGDVPLGIIFVDVKASTIVDIGEIAGPCKGFEISGTVYTDADSNGTLDTVNESGIQNVTVTLEDGGGNVETAITDENGYYRFFKSPGTYTIRIDESTAADDFNEQLASSFDPTGPTSLIVTVGPDSQGNNFGFDPRVEEITYDIMQGTLLTTGESIKYWKRELRSAINGGKGRSEYDLATMTQFIAEIQEFYLPDPFQFTPGNEFQEAMDIISTNSKDPLPTLLKELLMAELNEVSGKGLVGVPGLQPVLLAWVESVYVEALAATNLIADLQPAGGLIDDRVAGAIDLLTQLNGTTGGGGGGGG